MNDDVPVRDVMTREFVGVSEGDAMAGVAELVLDAGTDGAVVLRGAEPVGTIEPRHVVGLLAEGADGDEVTAGAVMDGAVSTVDPDRPLREAISSFASQDPTRLVVVEDGGVVGTLTEHDVVAAQATFPTAEAPVEAPPVSVNGGADDRYSTQSVCEGCGSLAESLASVNGQLLCADCREL